VRNIVGVRSVEVSRNGKSVIVPAVEIDGAIVITSGTFPRIAAVRDESIAHAGVPRDPAHFIHEVAHSPLHADVVTFAQHIYDATPRYPYYFEWDNVAAADTRDFSVWWEGLPQATRKNCRRSERRGAITKVVAFDERLAREIKGIYDEAPVRQGRRFWHYGKPVETVHRENSSYLDRSDFLATYFNEELIGFAKLVYAGRVAWIMQILSRMSHFDKRPTNALIAKAVEVCGHKGMSHLIYSKYQYGNSTNTALMEFKTRNGFERLQFPRYYVPLTLQGKVALACRLHRGVMGILPPTMVGVALRVREFLNAPFVRSEGASASVQRRVNVRTVRED
jgi:hypothetical protein